MKIVYVIHHPGEGGMENHVFLLAKYAVRSGHKVDFIFGGEGPLVERVKTLGCGIHFVKMRAPYDLLAAVKLSNLFKAIKPDVVHTHFMRENFLVIDAAKLVKVPAIFTTVHRIEPKNVLQALVNRYYSRALTKVIAVSPIAKQYLLDEGINEGKIVTILNGAEAAGANGRVLRKKLGIKPGETMISYVGRFTAEKGHATLVRAFAKMKGDNMKLVLMGAGELQEEIKLLTKKLKTQDKVIFTDVEFIGDRDNTIDLIAGSDIYVQPSEIENLPTSVVEAMLLSTPVVASDCAAHRWLLKDGERGYLFKNKNAKDLAAKVGLAFQDAKKKQKVAAARQYAESHLTAERMWETTEKIYQRYVSRSEKVVR